MTTAVFPKEFADLEPFADWSLEHEPERYTKRLSSSMDMMQAFYDATFPRARVAMDYLNQFTLNDLPLEAKRLLWLLYSLITVSFPIEVWKQPHVPDSGANDFTGVGAPAI
jgi:hypothetical protein